MHIKSQRDFFSGLSFIVIGIAFAVGASTYPMGSSANPGAGFFPLILAVLMALLGALVLFKSLTIETEGGDPIGAIAWRPLTAIMAAIAVFGFSIERLGLLVSVPLLVVIASLASKESRPLGVAVNAAVLTLLTWLVFVVGLKLSLPLWPAPGAR